ncbi:hypothetical protein BBD39_07715 [Arsenophonus endosymbiont of Bemisia tabaci Asia II 3]|nr:hypothetical protein BBD39_07715 [Arsenophonus endosymbiont of Bemisia tabaci Asia II 3]
MKRQPIRHSVAWRGVAVRMQIFQAGFLQCEIELCTRGSGRGGVCCIRWRDRLGGRMGRGFFRPASLGLASLSLEGGCASACMHEMRLSRAGRWRMLTH